MMRTFLFMLVLTSIAQAIRLKDIASLQGVRDNPLIGYGIVVGLMGTGDKNQPLTEASLGMFLRGLGVDLQLQKLDAQNLASVMVSANLAAFSRVGSRFDVVVSSIGSATSLEGGSLLMTPLKGADGNVYAIAAGKCMVSKKPERNRTTAGSGQSTLTATVLQGALLEREVLLPIDSQKGLRYHLKYPDFTTAARLVRKINEELSGRFAQALDASTIEITAPPLFDLSPVDLIAQVETVEVEPDRVARVILNPRLGTVVFGDQVRIAPVALSHHGISLEITENKDQTAANSQKTVERKIAMLSPGPNVTEIVNGLNSMGVGPEDLVSILQGLKASGALMAELEIQ